MAKQGQQIDELFISLGLDIAQLQLDFDVAGQTVSSAIQRLNSSGNKIKLQMETDLSRLEGVGSELDKIKVKYEAINRQLDLQRQKESILAAVFKDAQKNTGADSYSSRKAETDLLRQQKLIAQTEAELRKLAQAGQNLKINVDGTQARRTIGDIISDFQNLKNVSSVGELVSKLKGLTEAIPTVGKFAAAVVAIPTALKLVENSLVGIARPAITAGDAFYVMSRGLQMSIKDTAQLSTVCKVTGIEINEVINTMRRLNNQLVKSNGTDNLSKTLKQYGVETRNANGELKNAYEMSIALAEGLQKAKEAGRGKDFLAATLGRNASGDMVTYLEDLKGNIEQAKKVVKNGLSDPARAHAIQGEINTMEAQAAQLNSAFSSAFIPIAEKIIPQTTERLGELTKVIAQNADDIKTVGEEVSKVVNAIETVATKATIGVTNTVGELGETINILKNAGFDDYLKQGKTAGMILGGMVGGAFGGKAGAVAGGSAGYAVGESIYALVGEQYLKFTGEWGLAQRKALLDQEAKANQQLAKIKAEVAEAEKVAQKEVHDAQITLDTEMKLATSQRLRDKLEDIQESTQKSIEAGETEAAAWKKAEAEIAKAIKEARAEAEKANEELKQSIYELTHNDLQNKFDKIDLQAEEMLNRGADYDLVQQNAELQRQKIQADFDRDVLSKVNQSYQTDLQNKLQVIEQEKTAWQQKGLSEIEATRWAESEKAKVIKDFNNEVAANLESIYQTELEKRLAQIEREKQAWIQKGVDEVKSTEWAEQAKVDAQRNAAMQILKQQAEEYKIFKNEGYGGLLAYQKGQLIKSGIDPADLYMTPQQLADFQKAKQISEKSLLPNFMTPADIAESNRLLQQWHSDQQEKYQQWASQNWIEDDNGNRIDLSEMYNQQNKILYQKQSGKNLETLSYNPAELYQKEMQNLGITPDTNILQSFSQQTEYVTQKLADFGNVIENLNLTPDKTPVQNYSDGGNISQRQPVNVNNTIQIDQATAWDSEHIQQLAEKVADKITPAVEQALGGGENSY